MGTFRRFSLDRQRDPSGVSGEGEVAVGCEFPDGSCVLRWRTEVRSTVLYESMTDLIAVHGHNGATSVVYWE